MTASDSDFAELDSAPEDTKPVKKEKPSNKRKQEHLEDDETQATDNTLKEGNRQHVDKAEKWKQVKKETKLRKRERRAAKPQGAVILEANQLWETARKRALYPEERQKLIHQLWDLFKENPYEIALKRNGSRIFQTIVKYADDEMMETITEALKPNIFALCESQYGSHFIAKILAHRSRKARTAVVEKIQGKVRHLLSTTYGWVVVEEAYRDYATGTQKKQLYQELYGNEFTIFRETNNYKSIEDILEKQPAKKDVIMDSLVKSLKPILTKGLVSGTIVHRALLEVMTYGRKSDIEEIVELSKSLLPEILHSKNGSQASCLILAHASVKDKKHMISQMSEYMDKIFTDKYGFIVPLVAFEVVDDTKMTRKYILSKICTETNFRLIFATKFGFKPLLSIMQGPNRDFLYANQYELVEKCQKIRAETSIKEDDLRRKQLQEMLVPKLLEYFEQDYDHVMSEIDPRNILPFVQHEALKDTPIGEKLVKQLSEKIEE